MRKNVDPFDFHSGPEIIDALIKVNLWHNILEPRGGLNADFSADALSRGQQQLLALARAILRKSKILILDEATSSVDSETERTMRRLIAEEFVGSTILTITHRPQTILDSDVVAVLHEGKIVEFGDPKVLMDQTGSRLSSLVKS